MHNDVCSMFKYGTTLHCAATRKSPCVVFLDNAGFQPI